MKIELKRYDINWDFTNSSDTEDAFEDEEGQWVPYSDNLKKAVEYYNANHPDRDTPEVCPLVDCEAHYKPGMVSLPNGCSGYKDVTVCSILKNKIKKDKSKIGNSLTT